MHSNFLREYLSRPLNVTPIEVEQWEDDGGAIASTTSKYSGWPCVNIHHDELNCSHLPVAEWCETCVAANIEGV